MSKELAAVELAKFIASKENRDVDQRLDFRKYALELYAECLKACSKTTPGALQRLGATPGGKPEASS
ncbi:MAG TPA: hypothetical protein VF614_17005 [Chthoniobacteraceae bacterium]|jgi:hypothetical protein